MTSEHFSRSVVSRNSNVSGPQSFALFPTYRNRCFGSVPVVYRKPEEKHSVQESLSLLDKFLGCDTNKMSCSRSYRQTCTRLGSMRMTGMSGFLLECKLCPLNENVTRVLKTWPRFLNLFQLFGIIFSIC